MIREPVILFRHDRYSEDEYRVASSLGRVVDSRSICKRNTVVGRFSTLPFYRELEEDLRHNDCELINPHNNHLWIANFDYYRDLRQFTFESWSEDEFPRTAYPGPFVVKGMTNSKKHDWDTMMFAKDRRAAIEVAGRLRNDSLIGTQRIVFRRYEPLRMFEQGLSGLRFTNEWRFFFWGISPLAWGYYWTEAEDAEKRELSPEGIDFACKVAHYAAEHCQFFVLDIGEKESGGWVLIEVNDGSMSGLSMIEPEGFYRNLFAAIKS